jgi:hypothetical protein
MNLQQHLSAYMVQSFAWNEFTDLLKIIIPIHAQKSVDKQYFNNQQGCHVQKNVMFKRAVFAD